MKMTKNKSIKVCVNMIKKNVPKRTKRKREVKKEKKKWGRKVLAEFPSGPLKD